MKKLALIFVLALGAGLLTLGSLPAGADPGTLVVDDDAVECPDPDHNTIQAAVNAASPGDTIQVCPGTYDEQVSVSTASLTIEGAGTGQTVIQPSNVSANTTSFFSGNPLAAIVLVDSVSDVVVRGLTVDGSAGASDACPPGYMGIFYRGATGIIKDTRVTEVFNPDSPGCQTAIGIFVQSGDGQNATVTITDNVVDRYGKNGITANEGGTDVIIENNAVAGRGPVGQGDAAQNGIQIGFGARGTVSGNTVSDNFYEPDTFKACGLLLFGGGGLHSGQEDVSTANTFEDNEQDVCVGSEGPNPFDPVEG